MTYLFEKRYEYTTIAGSDFAGTAVSLDLTDSLATYSASVQFQNVRRVVMSAGGYPVDQLGGLHRPLGQKVIVITGHIICGSYNELDAAIDAYFSLHNSQVTVTRRRIDGGADQTATCLYTIRERESSRMRKNHYPVEIVIEPLGRQQFYGTTRTTTQSTISSGATFDITNNGNDAYFDTVITAECDGGTNITSFTIGAGNAELNYTGTLSDSLDNVVEIDAGALTVELAGADGISNFSRTSNHATLEWFPVPPGTTTVTATFSGTGTPTAEVVVTWKDAYRL